MGAGPHFLDLVKNGSEGSGWVRKGSGMVSKGVWARNFGKISKNLKISKLAKLGPPRRLLIDIQFKLSKCFPRK